MKQQLLIDWPDIKAVLARTRKERGVTLEILAARLGISPQAAHHYERKGYLPRLDTLYAWAEALGYEMKISLVKRGDR